MLVPEEKLQTTSFGLARGAGAKHHSCSANINLVLAGLEFEISAKSEALTSVISETLNSYEQAPIDQASEIVFQVRIQQGGLPPVPSHAVEVMFHESRYEGWTATAERWNENEILCVAVLAHGLYFRICQASHEIDVIADQNGTQNVASVPQCTAIFTALRNLATHLRPKEAGLVLHASAVYRNSGCVAFIGSKGAGKTTALLESMLLHGAQGVSNDRIFVSFELTPRVNTWPGSVTFCSATLSRYPQLLNAIALEREKDLYRGDFSSDKQLVSMASFCQATEVQYVPAANLRSVVILDHAHDGSPAMTLDLCNNQHFRRFESELLDASFDTFEPDFAQWHGLSSERPAANLSEFVCQLKTSGVNVVRTSISRLLQPSLLLDLLT